MKRLVAIVAMAVIALSSVPVSARAAEGVEITPSIIEKRVDPGASLEQVITIKNPGDVPVTYYPRVADISGMDEDGAPVFVQEGTVERIGAELSSWAKLSVAQVTVLPASEAAVTLTVTVPANAPIGGAFGAVLFSVEPPAEQEGESAVAIGYSVGSLVALRIGDDGSDEAAVREFRSAKTVYGGPTVSFVTRIENTGTALAKPYGQIQIFDTFGRFTASVSFNEKLGGILPKQVRLYDTTWTGSGFALGRYKANLIVTYGGSVKKSLLAETTFWVLPGKLSLIVAAVAIALFLIVYFWVRSYVRRALRGSGDSVRAAPISFFAVFISIVAVAAIIVGIIFFLLA
jgi:hypothetical protein